ncbi:MAG: ABC transporter ATP-binding protein/permease [Clostridia bacterium]|nr:ABC transporter ATP-binding protein/permease [Clostridia bacterium]
MIKVENLRKVYDKGTKQENEVLHNLSFQLPDTGFVCILGTSGSGKTSLLNAIGGLDTFDGGTIITENTEIKRSLSKEMERERNANFGYIFQNYYLLTEHSVSYNVLLGMHSLDIPYEDKLKRVKEALSRVDMLRYRKRPVGELSGGQQQRVAIARAIARRPRVIFADEPTGNLDASNTRNICTILKELSKESLVVMVTHEREIAEFFADRIITVDSGNIVSDSTEWKRGIMDAGEKDTVYSGDYSEENISIANLSVRMLSSEDAAPVALTVVAEKDRIIIKFDDKRVVLSSTAARPPFLKNGEHPILTDKSFSQMDKQHGDLSGGEKKESTKRFLGVGFLFNEAKGSISKKKLNRFGLGVFIIILTLILSISVSDFVTASHLDPEDYINHDSHTLLFDFIGGPATSGGTITYAMSQYVEYLENSGIDFDIIPNARGNFVFKDDTVKQISNEGMELTGYSLVNISRFDKTTLIAGRMPKNNNEIIVDRWVLDQMLKEDGILQNMITDVMYFLGKTVESPMQTDYYCPKIVGICDSGEPSIYISTLGLMAIGKGGSPIISLSEYKELTGFDPNYVLQTNECIALDKEYDLVPGKSQTRSLVTGESFIVKDSYVGLPASTDIRATLVVSDEVIEQLYYSMIARGESTRVNSFSVWTKDKDSLRAYLNKGLTPYLTNMLTVSFADYNAAEYNDYLSNINTRQSGRVIVIASVILLSLVMLYLMQRSRIKERMDLVTVYRLLGVPKRNMMLIFAFESVITTLKFSLPTVALIFAAIQVLSRVEALEQMLIFPWWAALLTFAAILGIRLIFALIPIFTLNRKPPARLAADYDF